MSRSACRQLVASADSIAHHLTIIGHQQPILSYPIPGLMLCYNQSIIILYNSNLSQKAIHRCIRNYVDSAHAHPIAGPVSNSQQETNEVASSLQGDKKLNISGYLDGRCELEYPNY